MNKALFRPFFILLLCLPLLLAGCALDSTPPEPLTVSETSHDFLISATIPQQTYRRREVSARNPVEVEVRVQYIGEAEEIKIRHAYTLSIVDWDVPMGDDHPGEIWLESLGIMRFVPRGWQTENHDCGYVLKHYKTVEAGEYTARVHVKFTLDDEPNEQIDVTLELPFIVE